MHIARLVGVGVDSDYIVHFFLFIYAAVNGKLTLLKGRQRFDTVSTSNLKV